VLTGRRAVPSHTIHGPAGLFIPGRLDVSSSQEIAWLSEPEAEWADSDSNERPAVISVARAISVASGVPVGRAIPVARAIGVTVVGARRVVRACITIAADRAVASPMFAADDADILGIAFAERGREVAKTAWRRRCQSRLRPSPPLQAKSG
jgi:hypothetical protein